MADAILSRQQRITVGPLASGRAYEVAALSIREKAAFRADLRRAGARQPARQEYLAAMREILAELEPANLAECLAIIEEAEHIPADAPREELIASAARTAPLEAAMRNHPRYAELDAQATLFNELLPLILPAHALRAWSGPGLPPFRRVQGAVPDELMESVPEAEREAIMSAAFVAFRVTADAEKNFAPPSLSH